MDDLRQECRTSGPLGAPRSAAALGYLTQIERYERSADNSVEVERGWIARGDTLTELAEALGIDGTGLEAEVARYYEWVEAGIDDPVHGRRAAMMRPLGPGPFHGYQWGSCSSPRWALRRHGPGRRHGLRQDRGA